MLLTKCFGNFMFVCDIMKTEVFSKQENSKSVAWYDLTRWIVCHAKSETDSFICNCPKNCDCKMLQSNGDWKFIPRILMLVTLLKSETYILQNASYSYLFSLIFLNHKFKTLKPMVSSKKFPVYCCSQCLEKLSTNFSPPKILHQC